MTHPVVAIRLFVCSLIVVVAASPLMAICSSPSLVEQPSIAANHDAAELAVGDVDGDNDVDLVTVSSSAGEIKVRLGNGDGSFGLELTYPAPSPAEVALGDLNGDGFADVIVSSEPAHSEECVSFGSCAGFSVLLNDGDGTFGTATTTPIPYASGVVAIDVADFDGDGHRDVLAAAPPLSTADPALHVFFGNGGGGFSSERSWSVDGTVLDAMGASLSTGTGPTDVVAVVGPGTSSTFTRVNIYASQSGTFPAVSASRNVVDGASPQSHLATADFNGDGKLDIAVSYRHSPSPELWGVSLVLTNGPTSTTFGGSFALTMPAITDIAAEDVDEDGDPDVMATSATSGWTAFRRNTTGFETSVSGGSLSGPAARVITKDFNHDGRPDFFFLDVNNDKVLVLRNTCTFRFASVAVTSSPNPSTLGSDATFTITVTPKPGAPMPTGTVTLFEGDTILGSAPINESGNAILTLANLSTGSHNVRAQLASNNDFESVFSPYYAHTVALPPFGPAFNVTATGNAAAARITVHWTATADAASHDVYRRLNGGAWDWIGNSTGDTFFDTNVVNTAAYVYAVRSHSTSAAVSGFSNSDIGTTAVLAIPSDKTIRATDFTATRSLVNSLRSAAGLSAFPFTDPALSAGTKVKAAHLTELRTAVNQARTQLGFPALPFTNPTITPRVTPVRLIDIQEIRNSFQ
jgi:hypothetical protein